MQTHDPESKNTHGSFAIKKDFTFFFKQYYGSLCYFANRYVADQAIAEDIVSECLVNIWKKQHTIASTAIKNYCYTTVRHACLRWLENRRRHQQHLQSVPIELYTDDTALNNMIRTETLEQLYTAIQNLPPKTSITLTKLYVEGKTVAETAEELQVTVSTIKSQKKSGLALLRNMITRVMIVIF